MGDCMARNKKTIFVISTAQQEVVQRIVDRWQKRLDRQRPVGGRTKVTQTDVIRAGLKTMAEQEGFKWPEDVVWGGIEQPEWNELFPEGDIFIQRTADGRAIVARYTWDQATGIIGQKPAVNWRDLQDDALKTLDTLPGRVGQLAGEHPCPPEIANRAIWD